MELLSTPDSDTDEYNAQITGTLKLRETRLVHLFCYNVSFHIPNS
jgi:fatty acid desaturase